MLRLSNLNLIIVGDINDPSKLKKAAAKGTTEKEEEWISPAMQNLIAEGKLPKPEGFEEKLKRQEERERETRGTKRFRYTSHSHLHPRLLSSFYKATKNSRP